MLVVIIPLLGQRDCDGGVWVSVSQLESATQIYTATYSSVYIPANGKTVAAWIDNTKWLVLDVILGGAGYADCFVSHGNSGNLYVRNVSSGAVTLDVVIKYLLMSS